MKIKIQSIGIALAIVISLFSTSYAQNCWDYVVEKRQIYLSQNKEVVVIEFVWHSDNKIHNGYGGNHFYVAHKENGKWIGECNEEAKSVLVGENWEERTKNRYKNRNVTYVVEY